MKTIKSTLAIKFHPREDGLDPSSNLLEKLMEHVNDFLNSWGNISNPQISQNYLYFDYTHKISRFDDEVDDVQYETGLVAGYLMSKGFTIL